MSDPPSSDPPSSDRPSSDRPSSDRPSTGRPGSGRPSPGGEPKLETPDRSDGLSHLDRQGRARMVDVGDKPLTAREAVARGHVRMTPETLSLLTRGEAPKGDVLATARIAGIQAAKRTSELIPLCHAIALTAVAVSFEPDPDGERLHVEARARAGDRTGVEMEALMAVSVAALTIYDMLKAVDRGMVIGDVRVISKAGGRSGDWSVER